ncbi:putative beta-lysine N-acetyltransferase [Bacillus aquiflavi]|uniref:Putative beta-lysine N-acetyltransferase n=2 Tax=Bacillus aquiflavi TaxID=2672567 RepID=A0A6B3W3D8_9BACI|nr:putative beta-lysine N-acetyltransferase [Bacillus aquiflavi]NEY82014.1 putative beta-lysine N-acetyltransferase [Bacillus aquiflavi]
MNMKLATSTTIKEEQFSLEIFQDPFNKRIRIDDYQGNVNQALERAEQLASNLLAEKLIVKGRREHFSSFLEKGYRLEGCIDHYFLGSDCYFFTKYFTLERQTSPHLLKEDTTINEIYNLPRKVEIKPPPVQYKLIKATQNDAEALALLYGQVFQVYPTPLNDPEYIKDTMSAGTIYYCFKREDQIVSAASAEVNQFYKNAELTDCATLVEHRKYGLMKLLLQSLEQELINNGIYCSYSIARALSFGMNAALYQLGYHYRGRLINNCYIFDKIENMNIWVKNLSDMPISRQ